MRSGLTHLSYILVMIPFNFRCETFVPNTPPRDDGSLSVNFGIFGQESMGRVWDGPIIDRVGLLNQTLIPC